VIPISRRLPLSKATERSSRSRAGWRWEDFAAGLTLSLRTDGTKGISK
jgi:hypothetical protein